MFLVRFPIKGIEGGKNVEKFLNRLVLNRLAWKQLFIFSFLLFDASSFEPPFSQPLLEEISNVSRTL